MRNWAGLVLCLLMLMCVNACSFWVDTEGQNFSVLEKGEDEMLEYRLDAKVQDAVIMALRVKNISGKPVQFKFRSSQQFDFVIEQKDKVVWRWSHDQSFAQMLISKTLPPGEELSGYQAMWTLQNLAGTKVDSGRYILKAYFLGVSKQIPVAQVEFEIP